MTKCEAAPCQGGGRICLHCQRFYAEGAEAEECARQAAPAMAVDRAAERSEQERRTPCQHRGSETRRVTCTSCAGLVELKAFGCAVHGECTLGRKSPPLACCGGDGDGCPDYVPRRDLTAPHQALSLAPCCCAAPGWCEAHARYQTLADWQMCRGLVGSPAECDATRTVWLRESQGSSLACAHRDPPRAADLFGCKVHGLARLRNTDGTADKRAEAVCEACPDRGVLRPQLLRRRRIDPAQLLPGDFQFNNSIVRFEGKLLMAYRLHWAGARLVLAEIEEERPGEWRVVRNWPLHLTTGLAQEDPRLFVHRGQLHVSYSALHQAGGEHWTNIGYARLDGSRGNWRVAHEWYPHYAGRQRWEKNWGFFEWEGELLCVYSIQPHRVLRVQGERAELIAETPCPFPNKPGLLHGGAPPVFHRGEFYSFYHRRLGASHNKAYTLDLYTFEARPPFRPSRQIAAPLLVPQTRDRPEPNVPHAIFPGGAFIDERHRWNVSFGYYDKWSEVAEWDINQLEACLVPLPGSPLGGVAYRPGTNDLAIWKEVQQWNEYGLPERFAADDVIVDLGAHVGAFSRACLDRGAGLVVACEPFPPSFELLKINVAPYVHRCGAWQVAVGAERGTLTLRNRDTTGRSHVAVSGTFEGGPVVCETSVVPLADVLPPTRVRLLKIDAEGAEYDILAGADLSRVEQIVGEAHRVSWRGAEATVETLAELLAPAGFTVTYHALGADAWLFSAQRGPA